MNRFSKENLAKLYDSNEIRDIWSQGQSLALIEHLQFGGSPVLGVRMIWMLIASTQGCH